MTVAPRQVLSVILALLSMIDASVLDSPRSVEERTRMAPIVVRGIVVARGQNHPRTFTISIRKVLKGANHVTGTRRIEIVVADGQYSGTVNLTTVLTKNGTGDEMTTETEGASPRGLAEGTSTDAGPTKPPVHATLRLLGRYIFFLMPVDEEGTVFEVAEDWVSVSKNNLRRIRSSVEKENNANENPLDDHVRNCTDAFLANHYCLNGGTCKRLINVDKPFCICSDPHSGERCDKIDPEV